MKNLPEKIYLNFGEITKEEFEADDYNEFYKLDEFAVTFCEDRVYDTDVEYIRKDAFTEKACDWLINHNDYIRGSTNGIVKYDMKQFIENFKKYMEE